MSGRPVFLFEQARTTGLLWAINKVLMHPRGFALGWEYPEGAPLEDIAAHRVDPIGFSVIGDGSEPWQFGEAADDESFTRFEQLLADHRSGTTEDGAS